MDIVWQGTIRDNLGEDALLRVRIERDEIVVEELDDSWDQGPGKPVTMWGECQDDALARKALEKAVLTLARR